MKITSIITLITISLCAGLCCPEEEENYNSNNHYLENYNLVKIQDNVTSLNLGQTLYINTLIENQQIDSQENTFLISDFDSTQYPLSYELSLYRLNSYGNLDQVNLNENSIEILNGQTNITENSNNSNIIVFPYLQGNQYVNSFGLTLLDTGTYFLGRNNFYNNEGTFFIYSNNENGSVQITTKIVNSNVDGLYEFVVE